ncbi:MAG: lytic transglycosylase domain-containing protein [Bacteroidetes bacterium]|nr:lytic transglycosylase domain-containing protein [Bacteroidota bacterium]
MQAHSLRKILLLSLILVFSAGLVMIFSFAGDTQEENSLKTNQPPVSNFSVYPPDIPTNITFAGENAQMDLFYVRESLDRELLVNTYWHSSTILMLKRANRWFPVIEPILKEYNIPDDFKYLALTESGFLNVVSPKGATGFWQFLEKTAKEYGLEINDYVDERYNVEKSTEAACRYFLDSFEEYQNWTLVGAAYNAGKRRITESLEQQKADNYYDLYLNDETSRYIYRIMAIKIICENPAAYGFMLDPKDLYPAANLKKELVEQSIPSLVDYALEHHITYKLLKEYNPWLRSDKLPNSTSKQYYISLPLD